MKNKRISLSTLVTAAFLVISLGSCNRGYGCPYDFSIIENLGSVVFGIFKLLCLIF